MNEKRKSASTNRSTTPSRKPPKGVTSPRARATAPSAASKRAANAKSMSPMGKFSMAIK